MGRGKPGDERRRSEDRGGTRPEGAGKTWKQADVRRGAKRDGLSDRHAYRVWRADSARHRSARGGARVGAQLAVALSQSACGRGLSAAWGPVALCGHSGLT